ncbi:MAG: hypothetical protein RIS86_640 [Planctomycetota bacterium]|jgi:putative ABC transport system permease protein
MRALWPFARRSLLGRRGRTALLVAAVALATSLVVAVTSGMRTAQDTLDRRLAERLGNTDVRVVHRYAEDFEESLLAEVRAWPGVARAAGRRFASVTLANPATDAAGDDGRPPRLTAQARGIDLAEDERLREVNLVEGRRLGAPGEILLDPKSAAALSARPGDTLRIVRFGKPIEVVVAGIYERPSLGALQRPIVEIDLATLAEATRKPGRLTAVAIELDEGVDPEAWCEANAARVEDPMIVEPAERVRTGLDKQAAASAVGAAIAAIIAFLSCAAIVATGMTTAVLEELREMGVARSIGASRAQLFGSQILVGGAIGLSGGVLGVPLGLAFVAGIALWYRDLVRGLPSVDGRGIALAVAGGLTAGLAGALFPALRASRISPLEALSVRARPVRARAVALAALAALGAIGIWALLLLPSDRDARFWLYAFLGLPLLHAAWFLLSVPATLLAGRVLAPAIGRLLGLPAGLLAGSVARMPWRLGFTAGALMVAVSILVSTRSNGEAIIDNLRERIRFADGFIFSTSGLSKDEQARLAALPGIGAALPIGYLPLKLAGEQVFGVDGMGPSNVVCVGFEPRPFLEVNQLEWIEGDPETAIARLEAGDAVLVAPEFLVARGIGLGDSIRLGSGANEAAFEVAGVVTAAGLDLATQTFGMRQIYMEQAVSCVFMDFATVERHFRTRDAYIMQLRLSEPPTEASDLALSEAVADAVPGAVYSSGRAIRSLVDEIGGTILAVWSGVAGAALLLAAVGVGSVVAAGIDARRREFGVLRAVGASPATLVGLVLGETATMAAASLLTGTALGMMLAWMGVRLYREFGGLELRLVVPVGALAAGAAVVVLVALLAATPAVVRLGRRPARELLSNA